MFLEGSGGNIAVLTGRDGKLLIDAGFASHLADAASRSEPRLDLLGRQCARLCRQPRGRHPRRPRADHYDTVRAPRARHCALLLRLFVAPSFSRRKSAPKAGGRFTNRPYEYVPRYTDI